MQLARFRARNAVKLARLSGICVKRFDERSRRNTKLLHKGDRLLAGIEVDGLFCYAEVAKEAPLRRREDTRAKEVG